MTELIAEIAQAHDGSLGILHSYIDAIAGTGIKTIKFQTHIAEAESSEFEPFRIAFSQVDNSRYDYWKRMEFSAEQWAGIKKHCDDKGLSFISSPFSVAAVDLLEKIGIARYKIGSGEASNLLLLERIAQTGKPVLLSNGLISMDELDTSVACLEQKQIPLTLLQCTTAYPTKPGQWNFAGMATLRNRYNNLPVGYSDHSGTPVTALAASVLGADVVEFHAVFDRRMFGPDASASLEINEIKWLREALVKLAEDKQKQTQEDVKSRLELQNMFGKSLALNTALSPGTVLQFGHLESKKPYGKGIPPSQYAEVIGRKLQHSKEKWSFLQWEDLENE